MALFGVPNLCPENDTPNGAIWHPTSWVPHGTIGLLVPSGTIYEAFGIILLMRSQTGISFHTSYFMWVLLPTINCTIPINNTMRTEMSTQRSVSYSQDSLLCIKTLELN